MTVYIYMCIMEAFMMGFLYHLHQINSAALPNMKVEQSPLLYDPSCHIVSLLFTTVLLTLPNSPNTWNVLLMEL